MCQACERYRHSVVMMASRFFGPSCVWANERKGADIIPAPTVDKKERRESMLALSNDEADWFLSPLPWGERARVDHPAGGARTSETQRLF